MLISQAISSLDFSRYIRAKYVNISKTIGDVSKVTIND